MFDPTASLVDKGIAIFNLVSPVSSKELKAGAKLVNKIEDKADDVKDAVKFVHGNSKTSKKAQHGYEIFEKNTGDVLEYGISGQKRNASEIVNSASPRIKQKLRTKYNNDPNVGGRLIDNNLPDRSNALDWEKIKLMNLKIKLMVQNL